ncbi:MAG TPA: RNase H-like domain-containing protein [Methylomicrobium sp.]|nr:RNase H-like domain-containing protein [Methylomicrobium sp.]
MDTGSAVNIAPARLAAKKTDCSMQLFAANNTKIEVNGAAKIHFTVYGVELSADVILSDSVDQFLLGSQWLKEHQAVWDFGKASVTILGRVMKLKSRESSAHVRRIYASQDVCVKKNCVVDVPVKMCYSSLHCEPSNWMLEPCLVAGRLFAPRSLFTDSQETVVRVVNVTPNDVSIRKDLCFGAAEPVKFGCKKCGPVCFCEPDSDIASGSSVRMVNVGETKSAVSESGNSVDFPDRIDDDTELIQPMLDSLPDCITADQRKQVEGLLREYIDIFSRHSLDVGCTNLMTHKLQLADSSLPPIRESLRRHPIAYLDDIDCEIAKMQKAGIVAPCNSPWAANLVLVLKRTKAPDGRPNIRIACDYRKLNQRLLSPGFPITEMGSVTQNLQGARIFHQLDLANAYLGLKLHPSTDHLTAFVTRRGQYKFLRLPAGLRCSPAAYSQLVSLVLGDMLFQSVYAYLDDWTVVANSWEEGLKLLRDVFERIRWANLRLRPQKCRIFQTRAEILGMVISDGKIMQHPSRAEKILKWKFPQTAKEVRGLLGFVNFSRDFYPNLAEIVRPFTDSLKKGRKIQCTPETREAFQKIKEIMTNPPVLSLYDPKAQPVVECDCSGTAWGAVLKNRYPDRENIVAYASRCLSEQQRRYCVTKRELTAILAALKKWRHLLLGKKVIIKTDHSALQYLLTGKNLTNQLARILEFLSDYDLSIEWISGASNRIADFLSRKDCNDSCKQCRQNPCSRSRKVPEEQVVAAVQSNTAAQVESRSPSRGDTPLVDSGTVGGDRLTDMRTGTVDRESLSPVDRLSDVSCPSPVLADQRDRTMREPRARVLSEVSTTRVAGTAGQPETASAAQQPMTGRVQAVQTRAQRRQVGKPVTEAGDAAPVLLPGKDIVKRPRKNTAAVHSSVGLAADWTIGYVADAQDSDLAIAQLKQWLVQEATPDSTDIKNDPNLIAYLRQLDSMKLIEGVVYRNFIDERGNTKYWQLVVPAKMRTEMLELLHSSILGHAKSFDKNWKSLQIYGYWPTQKRDLQVFLKSCRKCLEFHSGKLGRQGALRPHCMKKSAPNQEISCDLTGPHCDSQGYKYCLTAQDVFSKFLYLQPLRDKSAESVAAALVKIFLRSGFYSIIRTDCGAEWVNSLHEELYRITGAQHYKSVPYCPWENPVERTHRSMNQIIAKCIDQHKKWSSQLDFVAAAFNATVHKSTGFTPNFLQYGRELPTNLSVLLGNPNVEEWES